MSASAKAPWNAGSTDPEDEDAVRERCSRAVSSSSRAIACWQLRTNRYDKEKKTIKVRGGGG